MLNVTISDLRSNLLKYLKIAQAGEQITITSKGASLATLTPPKTQAQHAKIELQQLAKTAMIHDVVSPVAGAEFYVAKHYP